MKHNLEKTVVCVVGLGYVGLPLARVFSKSLQVIGFDTDVKKIKQLLNQPSCGQESIVAPAIHPTQGAGLITGVFPGAASLTLTTNPGEISKADFIIICVPTPLTPSKEPDLSYVKNAAHTVGRNLKRGGVVVLESSVSPGVTEEIVKPILEKESKLKCGRDFKLGYSPERINPGDEEHTIDKIAKVVAGMDEETTELLAELYHRVTPHVVKVKDIKTAEAAKIVENIQRDLNIALTNELAIIFGKMGLDTKEVLDAAASKWNFQRYSPGLVGGHCIPVSPYYLIYKAQELGYNPQVITAGRAINEGMPKYIAELTIKTLSEVGKAIKGSRVLVMGLAYKENVAYVKESPVLSVIKELKASDAEVYSYDPLLADSEPGFGIKVEVLTQTPKVDAIVLCVAHQVFQQISLRQLRAITSDKPVLIDVRGFYRREEANEVGFHYKAL